MSIWSFASAETSARTGVCCTRSHHKIRMQQRTQLTGALVTSEASDEILLHKERMLTYLARCRGGQASTAAPPRPVDNTVLQVTSFMQSNSMHQQTTTPLHCDVIGHAVPGGAEERPHSCAATAQARPPAGPCQQHRRCTPAACSCCCLTGARQAVMPAGTCRPSSSIGASAACRRLCGLAGRPGRPGHRRSYPAALATAAPAFCSCHTSAKDGRASHAAAASPAAAAALFPCRRRRAAPPQARRCMRRPRIACSPPGSRGRRSRRPQRRMRHHACTVCRRRSAARGRSTWWR